MRRWSDDWERLIVHAASSSMRALLQTPALTQASGRSGTTLRCALFVKPSAAFLADDFGSLQLGLEWCHAGYKSFFVGSSTCRKRDLNPALVVLDPCPGCCCSTKNVKICKPQLLCLGNLESFS
jgi:hypothetical protein